MRKVFDYICSKLYRKESSIYIEKYREARKDNKRYYYLDETKYKITDTQIVIYNLYFYIKKYASPITVTIFVPLVSSKPITLKSFLILYIGLLFIVMLLVHIVGSTLLNIFIFISSKNQISAKWNRKVQRWKLGCCTFIQVRSNIAEVKS